MKNSKKQFKEVYQLPLKLDKASRSIIWSANNVMTFNQLLGYSDENVKVIQMLLDILNGDSNLHIEEPVTYDKGYICIQDKPLLLLRGWGHLIGVGALNLDSKTAAKIQDDFAEWVVNKLKGNV